jgi:rod shape-determining protein MreD
MSPWPSAILLIFSCLFQILASPLYEVGGIRPDFPFLALIYLAFFAPPYQVFLAGGATAIGIDILSMDPLGTRLLGFLPVLWLLGRFRRTMIAESPLLRAGLALAACLASFGIQGAILAWKEGIWHGFLPDLKLVLYTALLGVAVHGTLDLYRARLGWVRDRYFA